MINLISNACKSNPYCTDFVFQHNAIGLDNAPHSVTW